MGGRAGRQVRQERVDDFYNGGIVAMTNTTVMLQWLDEHVQEAEESDVQILADMRTLIFIEGQRREAERLEAGVTE